MGTRSDVGSMFAIGSIKEDFLGFEMFFFFQVVIGRTDNFLGLCDLSNCVPSHPRGMAV